MKSAALAFIVAALGLGACSSPAPASATDQPATEPSPSPPVEPVTRSADGRCEPMPRNGDPCRPGDGYCVESWGEPGGRSSALWCRDGRWEREEEENLPAE